MRQLAALELADAVLGADAAAERIDDVVHNAVDLGLSRHEFGVLAGFRFGLVVVQVAVADVAEGDDTDARVGRLQGCIGALDEFADARDRHGNVVLDTESLDLLRLADALAQIPQVGRLLAALRQHGIADPCVLQRRGKEGFAGRAQVGLFARARQFDEQIPLAARQGRLRAANMLEHHAERNVGNQLARGQRGAKGRLQFAEQAHGGRRGFDGQPGGGRRARQRKELDHRGGNDAERAFGADEQLFEVVTGIVLAQAAQAVPDFARGQHDLQTERQFTSVAVTQHLYAAGIGRQIAADLATAFGGER